MAYRSRSKYTPGGGVLAFFEQVSRFVSLSVAVWIGGSIFLILFSSDGKITDSFDLSLIKSFFTDWQIFLTSIMLIAVSGAIGALISIPASLVLLITRQYLDFQLGRPGRKNAFIRIHLVKNLPAFVLVMTHVVTLFLNIVSAPQLTRTWFKEGNKISELVAGSHFVLTSLTRRATAPDSGESVSASKSNSGKKMVDAKRAHIILIPAEQMESEEFLAEIGKMPDAVRVPFVIPRSSVIDQIDTVLQSIPGPTSELARKTSQNAREYSKPVVKGQSQVIVSVSPQIRFGKNLAGYGTELMTGFNDSLLQVEAQRRLVLSQVQLFGVFRILDGVPFLNSGLHWLNLVADDVVRMRKVAVSSTKLDASANALLLMQLSGLEKEFRSVKSPFRPVGWSLQKSSYEARIVNKNFVRELIQYVYDVGGRESAYWVILPYADDTRTSPRSFALVSAKSGLVRNQDSRPESAIGVLSEDVAKEVGEYLSEGKTPAADAKVIPLIADKANIDIKLKTNAIPKLVCSETETEFADGDFKFQSADLRERTLGQLLNTLPVMPEADLAFLGKSMSSLVSRELGLGLICRTRNQSIEEIYLLKYRGLTEWSRSIKSLRPGLSVLLTKEPLKAGDSGRSARAKAGVSETTPPALKQGIRRDVLQDFIVLQFVPRGEQAASEATWSWRRLDERENEFFFAKYEIEALHAIELSARARIR